MLSLGRRFWYTTGMGSSCARKKKEGTLRGFTLVEVVIATAIMVTLGLVVLAGSGSQRAARQLLQEVYRIATVFREAQHYGVGTSGASGSFRGGYGVWLIPGGSQILLFGDENANYWFDTSDVVVDRVTLDQRFTIQEVCGTRAAGGWECLSAGTPGMGMTVLYYRPNPEAQIYLAPSDSMRTIGKVVFALTSDPAKKVELLVYLTGALEVNASL